ncbi:hypothetical protein RND59_00190 [Vibrio ruber]|uniref:hypothetical protein n=1 Tax=Vibrio ruber TaxID=184755 RepID=UPI00289319DF|nr:hypothetical protein [Vibrio ruber]WNJ95577.1 hypothetical protein RND59_00190 [Vibrio ruber]
MPYLTKLNRDIQIKRTEGKAALTQCLLAKQTLQFTATRFVRENPWMTLGIGGFVVFAVAKVRRLPGMRSSISAISLLFSGTMNVSRQLSNLSNRYTQRSSSQTSDASDVGKPRVSD